MSADMELALFTLVVVLIVLAGLHALLALVRLFGGNKMQMVLNGNIESTAADNSYTLYTAEEHTRAAKANASAQLHIAEAAKENRLAEEAKLARAKLEHGSA